MKCYSCNSLETGNCGMNFDPSALTDTEEKLMLQDCTTIPLAIRKLNITARPVCRKMITSSEWRRELSKGSCD